ncbi:hypothetical protein CLOM_g23202 [Closterium sp. NIES-68]|nr:hypothetical protein CLOM_g23202 [Closterium sp. NIES-68]
MARGSVSSLGRLRLLLASARPSDQVQRFSTVHPSASHLASAHAVSPAASTSADLPPPHVPRDPPSTRAPYSPVTPPLETVRTRFVSIEPISTGSVNTRSVTTNTAFAGTLAGHALSIAPRSAIAISSLVTSSPSSSLTSPSLASSPSSLSSLSSPLSPSGSSRGWLLAAGASFSLVAAFSGTATAVAKERPEVPLGRDAEVVLYQYEACPFCNKVKAFLDYYDLPYRVVEVNPVGKKELKWSEYKKVPVLMVNGEPLVDSSAIISELHRRLNPSKATNIPPAAPAPAAAAPAAPGAYASSIGSTTNSSSSSSTSGSSGSGGSSSGGMAASVGHVGERGVAEGQAEGELDEETRWRRWVDGHLVHLLSPNIYRSPSEALEAFDYIATNGKLY